MPTEVMPGRVEVVGSFSGSTSTSATRAKERRRAVRRWRLKQFFAYRWRELPMEAFLLLNRIAARLIPGVNIAAHGRLYSRVFRSRREDWRVLEHTAAGTLFFHNDDPDRQEWVPADMVQKRDWVGVFEYGHVGCHLVVTAGKNYVASCFNNVAEPESLKFHGCGSGTTAAAAGDVALQTEFTTQYATDNVRPTGSQANSGATYTTVASFAPDANVALTEWGLLSSATVGAGTLFDRQVFSAVNLVANTDTESFTYVLTLS